MLNNFFNNNYNPYQIVIYQPIPTPKTQKTLAWGDYSSYIFRNNDSSKSDTARINQNIK